MKDLRDQDEQLDTIREFFLEKDKSLTEKNDRMNKILDRCSEVSDIQIHRTVNPCLAYRNVTRSA